MPLGVHEEMLDGMRWDIRQPFTTKEAIFKAGVILIASKIWAKQGVPVCLFNMGGIGSELFFNQVDDQLSDFSTEDKEEIFKYITFDWKGTHISNYVVWRFMEGGKETESVQRQIIRRTQSIKMTNDVIKRRVTRSCEERMISLKTPNLFLALAKSSKAPKLLNSHEWAVIEKDVRSENGRRGNQGALEAIILRTGIALEMAVGERARRANDNRRIGTRGSCSTENCKNTIQQPDGLCNPCHDLVPTKLKAEFCAGVGGRVCGRVIERGNQCLKCYYKPEEKKMRKEKKAARPKCRIDGCGGID
jgi:hypothetical protein